MVAGPRLDVSGWLEEQLANTDATWKFVAYHHPAYSSAPGRNNSEIRRWWGDLFDKYHVDLALQGHDHAYLRTYPMKGEQRVDSAAEGTIYLVSVSGLKLYNQGDFDYTEFGMTNTPTYQILDIQISGDRLVYRAYDIDGNVPYNTARYINHSCDPNCEAVIIRGRIWIIALREIKKSEELAYNDNYDFEDYEDHKCQCGSNRCVGYILDEDDWPELERMKLLKKSA